MAMIFPREEKAEALFGEILKNPEACHRLMETFNDSLDMADVAGDARPRRIITRDTAIGDLTDEQIDLVMSSFGKHAQKKKEGDKSVSSIASRALQVNMPLRSLVSFGTMKEDGLEKMLAALNGQENV